MTIRFSAACLPLILLAPLVAQQADYDALATDILRELVEIRSSAAYPENTIRLLEGVAARLRKEGFDDDEIAFEPSGDVTNLVVRYRGSGKLKPLATMAHVDVVDADPNAWQADPFTFRETDGYYYGRGTADNKSGVATLITNFIRFKREGYKPNRDILMALTGDEETGMLGIKRLVDKRLKGSELAFNTDAGGGTLDAEGVPRMLTIQMSEKLYQTYELEATNPGGHSSQPRPDNAIYQLARALTRIETYRFPIELNEVVRENLRLAADTLSGEGAKLVRAAAEQPRDPEALRRLAASDPFWNSSMRTTCVATMLAAGVAENALPRSAKATVNCRILPGMTPEQVESTLREVVADNEIQVRRIGGGAPSPPSPVRADVMQAVRELSREFWGEVSVAPYQGTGATDGLWLRLAGTPVYGLGARFGMAGETRAHGLDERLRVDSFHQSVRFWYALLKRFSQ